MSFAADISRPHNVPISLNSVPPMQSAALANRWAMALHNVRQMRHPEAIYLSGAVGVQQADGRHGIHLLRTSPILVFTLSPDVSQQDIELRLHRFVAEVTAITADSIASDVVAKLDGQKKHATDCLRQDGALFRGECAPLDQILAVIDEVIERVQECALW